MAIELTKKFEKGNTAYFECYFRDMQSFLKDPTNASYTVIDIKGRTITTGIPSKKSTGLYYFFWTPLLTGDFIVQFDGEIDGFKTKMRKKFKVIETSLKGESWSKSSCSSSSSSCSSSSCSSSFCSSSSSESL